MFVVRYVSPVNTSVWGCKSIYQRETECVCVRACVSVCASVNVPMCASMCVCVCMQSCCVFDRDRESVRQREREKGSQIFFLFRDYQVAMVIS